MFGKGELLVIFLIILLLFGANRIPKIMSGLGKGIRSFRDGLDNQAEGDEKKNEDEK